MTKEDFYFRLVLNVLVGVMYVYALYRMARHTKLKEAPQKKIVMTIVGCFFISIAVLFSIVVISLLSRISYPSQSLAGSISSYLFWGYPTTEQNTILTTILNIFFFGGLGCYFLAYKKTCSTFWDKVTQFVFVFLLCLFMYSATNFHYLVSSEFIAPILFLVLWSIAVIIYRCPKHLRKSKIEITLLRTFLAILLVLILMFFFIGGDYMEITISIVTIIIVFTIALYEL